LNEGLAFSYARLGLFHCRTAGGGYYNTKLTRYAVDAENAPRQ
jgi:hypothetical protein